MTPLDPPQIPAGPGAAADAGAVAPAGPAAPAGGGQASWRPWHGRPRPRDLACASALVASALYSAATVPLTPLLIASHPLLLELLAGTDTSVVAAGAFGEVHGTPPAAVVAAALPAMMRSDWILWWAGRLWGRRLVDRLGGHRRIGLAGRRGTRFAVLIVAAAALLPGGTQTPLYAAVGWLGMPLPVFLLADAVGTAVWVALLTAFGYVLGGDGVHLAQLVSRYALAAICVPILAAAVFRLWRAWRRRARPAAAAAVPVPREGAAGQLPAG